MSDELGAVTELGGAAAIELAASALAARGAKADNCPNCGAPLIAAYCALCGQERDTHRHSLWGLVGELISEIASFDSRILRTAWALVARPGELSVAFREGRTRRYMPALRLYLFMSLIFFVSLSAGGIALLQLELAVDNQKTFVADGHHNVFVVTNGNRAPMKGFTTDGKGNVYFSAPGVSRRAISGLKADGSVHYDVTTKPHFFSRIGAIKVDPATGSEILHRVERDMKIGDNVNSPFGRWIMQRVASILKALATNPAAVNGPLTEWIPRVLFILLPLFALILAGFYWRQRKQYYFVDHLVFSLNYHTFGFALLLVAAALAQVLAESTVSSVVFIGLPLYLLLAMKRFYAQNWFWTCAKFAFVGFLYLCFLLPTILTVLAISLWRI
ncbi:MAG TPA: DUF3667 domain-containing protein [Rhizomicrobium sp.]